MRKRFEQSQKFLRQSSLTFRPIQRRCRLDVAPLRPRLGFSHGAKISRRTVASSSGLALVYAAAGVLAASLLIMLLSRISGAFADFWLLRVIAPSSSILSRLSGKLPFSLAEPLALLLGFALIALLLKRRGFCLLVTLVFAGYALLWYPAYFAPAGRMRAVETAADAERLESVCQDIIAALNESAFEMPRNLEKRALSAVLRLEGLPVQPAAPPKRARYPEWMQKFHLAGIFVPWTGEAVFDPHQPVAAQPFTVCHELMHLAGVADEGQANILAYEACILEGGAFAYSARLWALRYCLSVLSELDGARYQEAAGRLQGAAYRDFWAMGGFSPEKREEKSLVSAFLRLNGLSDSAANYAALTNYLCMDSGD